MESQKPFSPNELNVLGGSLEVCSCDPKTGWFRDGYCQSVSSDPGNHIICCVMTEGFLKYSKAQGNDLVTPIPEIEFKGLKPGDSWCICASRWLEAYQDGMAPKVRLEATHINTLSIINLETLELCANNN